MALADLLRRVGLILACVLGSSFLICLSAGMVGAVADLDPSFLWEAYGTDIPDRDDVVEEE